ncbi:LysE/ArgO family amino acid transporter [Glaciecola petra]|uniref:LysE family transporter n=1 Tax=Glaciecola petra TaxID=3075602 RepID=A0ABU2ZU98_9ALTE|nr:LysE family transporter [Aestuariibacter sp. P117]MDT0595159.1 LysE family transporter [Aestuariibacter sp. P117]
MSFLSGIGLGLSLIVAIGAQNIWVLSQSMAGANRLIVAGTCMLCDVFLIVIGVFAAQRINAAIPSIEPFLKWGGILLLSYLAIGAFKRAWDGSSGLHASGATKQAWQKTFLTALAISLLNPHVYLDTVILLGNIGAMQAEPKWFAAGACVGSVLWFSCLSFFAPKLNIMLTSVARWRAFDTVIGLILAFVAIQLYFIA